MGSLGIFRDIVQGHRGIYMSVVGGPVSCMGISRSCDRLVCYIVASRKVREMNNKHDSAIAVWVVWLITSVGLKLTGVVVCEWAVALMPLWFVCGGMFAVILAAIVEDFKKNGVVVSVWVIVPKIKDKRKDR